MEKSSARRSFSQVDGTERRSVRSTPDNRRVAKDNSAAIATAFSFRSSNHGQVARLYRVRRCAPCRPVHPQALAGLRRHIGKCAVWTFQPWQDCLQRPASSSGSRRIGRQVPPAVEAAARHIFHCSAHIFSAGCNLAKGDKPAFVHVVRRFDRALVEKLDQCVTRLGGEERLKMDRRSIVQRQRRQWQAKARGIDRPRNISESLANCDSCAGRAGWQFG